MRYQNQGGTHISAIPRKGDSKKEKEEKNGERTVRWKNGTKQKIYFAYIIILSEKY